MVLFPVHNTGVRRIEKFLEIDMHPQSSKPDRFRCLTDSEQAHAFTGDIGFLAEGFQRETLAIKLSNHPQAGRPTIHGVVLFIEGEHKNY